MKRERLEELREETAQYRAVADDRCMSTQYEDDILALIDEAIARQSVKREEVAEAITVLKRINHTREQVARMVLIEWAQPQKAIQQTVDLAIAALQEYQPTTRKNRTVEEVAISKTETTSEPCEYCRKPIYLKWNVSFIDGYYKLNDDCNYCPNCGRKLVK